MKVYLAYCDDYVDQYENDSTLLGIFDSETKAIDYLANKIKEDCYAADKISMDDIKKQFKEHKQLIISNDDEILEDLEDMVTIYTIEEWEVE